MNGVFAVLWPDKRRLLFNIIKSSNFLGISKFNILASSTNRQIVALGGINKLNIKKLGMLNVVGFSGISYFQKKTALLKRAV